MHDKLLGMLKPHVPDVERCNLIVEQLVDFIEEDRELEIEVARDDGYDEGCSDGYGDGYDKGHSEGYKVGYNDGLADA